MTENRKIGMTGKIKPPAWKRYPGHYPFDTGMGDALLSPALGRGNAGGGERIVGAELAAALRRHYGGVWVCRRAME